MRYFGYFIFLIIGMITGFVLFLTYYQPTTNNPISFNFPLYQKTIKNNLVKEYYLTARDKKQLFYRTIKSPRKKSALVIILHGSSYHGSYLIPLGLHLHELADICIPDIRGHGKSGPLGTCSYIGQLEDDLLDLIKKLSSNNNYQKIIIVGHSSGGGLAIRFAASKHKDLVHQLILLSPAIITAPTMNTPGAKSWAHINKIKIMELLALNAIGISRFNTTVVVKINKKQDQCDGSETLSYDYNLSVSMHPRIPYHKDLKTVAEKTTLLVGELDEINNPYAFEKLFPKDRIQILSDTGHLDIVNNQDVIAEIKNTLHHKE
jgi:non-heme chloroperoxidase